jgi:flagellar hook-basal body complex protein FliE
MNVGAIGPSQTQLITSLRDTARGAQQTAKPGGPSFGQMVSDAVQQLNQIQQEADGAALQVATGTGGDLHTALVTVEEASLALQLALQVRNKVVEAYQEVMRMQV